MLPITAAEVYVIPNNNVLSESAVTCLTTINQIPLLPIAANA